MRAPHRRPPRAAAWGGAAQRGGDAPLPRTIARAILPKCLFLLLFPSLWSLYGSTAGRIPKPETTEMLIFFLLFVLSLPLAQWLSDRVTG